MNCIDFLFLEVFDESDCSWEKHNHSKLKTKLETTLRELEQIKEELKVRMPKYLTIFIANILILQNEKRLALSLQQKLVKENVIDAKHFYYRLIYHFWGNVLGEVRSQSIC